MIKVFMIRIDASKYVDDEAAQKWERVREDLRQAARGGFYQPAITIDEIAVVPASWGKE